MYTRFSYLLALCVLVTFGAHAQSLYKWVDAQGNISYSDLPPPASASKDLSNTVNTLGAGQAQAESLGFEAQQLTKRNPVVLYTAKSCAPCDSARNLLKNGKTPYTEKTVNSSADLAALGKQFQTDALPLLAIGGSTLVGFNADEWRAAIEQAGYNANTAAPKRYQNGEATPLGKATPTSTSTNAANPANSNNTTNPSNTANRQAAGTRTGANSTSQP